MEVFIEESKALGGLPISSSRAVMPAPFDRPRTAACLDLIEDERGPFAVGYDRWALLWKDCYACCWRAKCDEDRIDALWADRAASVSLWGGRVERMF